MIRRLAKWLTEHGWIQAWNVREGMVNIWAFVLTIIGTFIWHYAKWDWQYYWQGLAGIVTFGLPLLAALIALVKRQKWNPWFWVPALAGMVLGGFLSAGLFRLIGWA